MTDLYTYLWMAGAASGLLTALYHIGLRKLTFNQVNRYYLLFLLLFSAAYPLVDIGNWLPDKAFAAQPASAMVSNRPEWTVVPAAGWKQLLAYAYWAGVLVFSARLAFRFWSLARVHTQSRPAKWQAISYRHLPAGLMPFSFFGNTYVHTGQHTSADLVRIFAHESVHVHQWHSIDTLLAEIYLVFFWFNPFAWYMRYAVYQNLEYIADRQVIRRGINRQAYQYSLLTLGVHGQAVPVNYFHLQKLKNRIIMMNKKKSSCFQLSAYLLLIPVVAGGLLLSCSAPDTLPGEAVSPQYVGKQRLDTIPLKIRGSGDSLKIGGPKDPLVIVDGKEISAAELKRLNSNDIAAMEIFKDQAATERYGSKGANGVILITTKKKKP